MHPCNRGEMLTRSVQENAANTTAATRTRPQLCERPQLFIGHGACNNGALWASNFLRSAQAARALPEVSRTTYSEVWPVLSTCVWKTTSRLPDPKFFDAARARTFSAHLVFSQYRSSSDG